MEQDHGPESLWLSRGQSQVSRTKLTLKALSLLALMAGAWGKVAAVWRGGHCHRPAAWATVCAWFEKMHLTPHKGTHAVSDVCWGKGEAEF